VQHHAVVEIIAAAERRLHDMMIVGPMREDRQTAHFA
jgi:hypothetical protein